MSEIRGTFNRSLLPSPSHGLTLAFECQSFQRKKTLESQITPARDNTMHMFVPTGRGILTFCAVPGISEFLRRGIQEAKLRQSKSGFIHSVGSSLYNYKHWV